MFRTSRFFKQFCVFFGNNSRLFLFLALILCGVGVGCFASSSLPATASPLLELITPRLPEQLRFLPVLTAFFQNSLVTLTAIGLLMLFGMSLYGLPAVAVLPFSYGVALGLGEMAVVRSLGAVGLLLTLPGTLVAVWAVLIACAEALKLTLRLIAQVMPSPSKSGLWRDFRLFFLRFMLCFLLGILGSAIQTTTAVFL